MKLSKKICIYFSIVILCAAGILLLEKETGHLLTVVLLILLAVGGVYSIWFVKTLEYAVRLIPEHQKFREHMVKYTEVFHKESKPD